MPLQRNHSRAPRSGVLNAQILAKKRLRTVCSTTIDSLSSNPSEDEVAQQMAEVRATGRASWRMLSGKPEPVWPPALESLLIQGLKKYHDEVGLIADLKLNGEFRFPLRNAFLETYIEKLSGKKRDRKQVSSRVQSLKLTSKDSRILSVILRGRVGLSSPVLPYSLPFLDPLESKEVRLRHRLPSIVFVQVVASLYTHPNQVPIIQIGHTDLTSLETVALSVSTQQAIRETHSLLSLFSNSIQLSCAFPLKDPTHFVVYEDEMVLQEEEGSLVHVLPHSNGTDNRTYDCEVMSSHWPSLISREDLDNITIIQTVFPDTRKIRGDVRAPESIDIVYYLGACDYSPYRRRGSIAYENARVVLGDFLRPDTSPPSLVTVMDNISTGTPPGSALSPFPLLPPHHADVIPSLSTSG